MTLRDSSNQPDRSFGALERLLTILMSGLVVAGVLVTATATAQETTVPATSSSDEASSDEAPVDAEPSTPNQQTLTPEWAAERTNLGNALQEQARQVQGESSRQLLAQSIIAYRSALEVFNRDEHPRLWAATLNNLGTALEALGAITPGEAGEKLLESAAAAHRSSLKVFTRDATPQDWAMTYDHLGIALHSLALRAEPLTRPLLLHESISAHRLALEILTPEGSPEPWSLARLNEARALQAAGKPMDAAEALQEAFAKNPDDRDTLLQLIEVLQDELYDHRGALQTATGWLQRFPDDTFVAVRSIEPLFALGRADETIFLSRHLQPRAAESGELLAILRTYEVASLLARKQPDAAAVALAELRRLVEARPEAWRPTWSHAGARRYLANADLVDQRAIVRLFEAVGKKDQAGALSDIDLIASQL